MDVSIINYGVSNLYSVQNVLENIGLKSIITNDNNTIINSKIAILPGVGAFGEAMKKIKFYKLDTTILKFIETRKPFIAICLGMQLLFEESDEFGNYKGLGILKGSIKKLSFNQNEKILVPNIGWNKVFFPNKNYLNTVMKNNQNEDFMYFVHSYYAVPKSQEIVLTNTQYNNFIYCSAVNYENITAFQFHPEKSGNAGIKIFHSLKKMII